MTMRCQRVHVAVDAKCHGVGFLSCGQVLLRELAAPSGSQARFGPERAKAPPERSLRYDKCPIPGLGDHREELLVGL
jgi:hypothetical protein